MQIIEIVTAKALWFAAMSMIDPEGIAIGPIHRGLLERYRFMNHPVPGPDTFNGTGGLIYRGGEFNFDGKPIGVNLTIFSDGLLGETSVSTDVTEAFLEDVSDWAVTLDLRSPKKVKTRTVYESAIHFRSEVALLNASQPIRTFTELLRDYTGNQTEEPWALLFQPDGGAMSFSFERRVTVAFAENQYFSKSVLPTRRHVELLEKFEKIFA
jgi:hypothetical protein